MEYNLNEKRVRLGLRKEYKAYVSMFKAHTNYDDFFGDSSKAKNLMMVNELHYFCMNDVKYNYDLIKKVYDIAFDKECISFVFKKDYTLYDFLVKQYEKYDDYNLLNWDDIVEFFNCIILNNEKTLKQVLEHYDFKTVFIYSNDDDVVHLFSGSGRNLLNTLSDYFLDMEVLEDDETWDSVRLNIDFCTERETEREED